MMRLLSLLLAAAIAFAAAAGDARADGDPASDYLVTTDVFTGVAAPPPSSAAALGRAVRNVYARGFRLKVAVIPTRTDLGAVPSLFNKPNAYAKFLGLEIRQLYAGPLLIVMPRGYGIYDAGRSTKPEASVLARLDRPGTALDALTRSALTAVQRLGRANALRSKDIVAPTAYPEFSTITPSTRATLRYRVQDDSERSGERVTIYDGQKVLARFERRLTRVSFKTEYSVTWTTPRTIPPSLRWCVVPHDPAGNIGLPSCLPLRTAG